MTDIYEYRRKVIKEIEEFIKTADLESYEISEAFRENEKHNPDYKLSTWRDFIYDSNSVEAIDKMKTSLFKVINNTAKIKRLKEADEKDKGDEKKKSDAEWWNDYYKENADYWQKSSQWWRDYNSQKHDWQKDWEKREAENKKRLEESEKDRNEKHKKEFISDIEMELIKENVSDERLSKRLGISDWKEKIRQADGFSAALSMKSNIIRIVWKLKDEYTCANCGEKKEEYTVYKVGSKKCCSYDCEKALKDKENGKKGPKEDDRKNDTPDEPKKGEWKSSKNRNNFGFSDIGEFFAWMGKMGVKELSFDFETNQVKIILNDNKKLSLAESGLSTQQQEALNKRFKTNKNAITYGEVSQQVDKGNNGNGNKDSNNNSKGGIIAAIVIVGIIFTAIISVVVYNSRKKRDY